MINNSVPLFNCVPHLNGDYMRDVFPHYEFVINILSTYMDIFDLRPMTKWCEENVGELDETSPKSPWNLSIDLIELFNNGNGNFTIKEVLGFHFHDEISAMAFKLAWS